MPMTRKQRPQSARLDILSMMAAGGSSHKRPVSPTDSLSPCREDFALYADKIPTPRSAGEFDRQSEHAHIATADDDTQLGRTSTNGPDDDDWFVSEPACPPLSGKSQAHQASTSTTPSVQTPTTTTTQQHEQQQEQLVTHVRSPKPKQPSSAAAAAASHTSLPTPSPRCLLSRSYRPSTISVNDTNGASTLPAYELKKAIQEAGAAKDTLQPIACNSPPSSPERGRPRHRRSPAQLTSPSFYTMGNQHSHHESADDGAFDQADDRSTTSVLRASRLKAARLPRRTSMNVFRRLDSKSPLPAELRGTVIEVPRAATAPNLDEMADDEETEGDEQERSRARHAHRHSAPSPAMLMHPESPAATLTEESAARPLSATGTITDRRRNTEVQDSTEDESPLHLRISALSPTLPAPSPMPEDSPHKYGLKDRMDTPEAHSPPPADVELAKARRRSSGLAIFNEAKTLQSASSFLNGLSTARRRAESRAQSRNATDNTESTVGTAYASTYQPSHNGSQLSYINLPASATTSTIHPYASISNTALPHMTLEADLDLSIDTTNRNLGHCFKSSGYAYAPALSITQLKCYRSHHRLLPSRNKHAPVECAVCHADDENQHWSCGWCALRMCGGCRKTFEVAGVAGLRERVRAGEMVGC